MKREEKIQDLKDQIDAKRHEIEELGKQLKAEIEADFYERNNLHEGQHFIYDDKECVGVKCGDDSLLRTFQVKKDGTISQRPTIIRNKETIKPI